MVSFSCNDQKKIVSGEEMNTNQHLNTDEILKNPQEFKTIYVASYKKDCEGVTNQSCYLVKENPEDEWKLFYSEIEGFEYKAGRDYTLTIEEVPVENPPADGSIFKYKLVSIDKTKVPDYITSGLFDIWGLLRMNGKDVNLKEQIDSPIIEINTLAKTLSGSTGCNYINSSFEYNTDVKSFKVNFPIAMTKRGCPESGIEPEFLKSLELVDGYRLEKLTLFLTVNGVDVMEFRKMD